MLETQAGSIRLRRQYLGPTKGIFKWVLLVFMAGSIRNVAVITREGQKLDAVQFSIFYMYIQKAANKNNNID